MGKIIIGDCGEELDKLEPESINCVVTSPPYYGLRDYGDKRQIGLEGNPDCGAWAHPAIKPCGKCYICKMVDVFRKIRRVLRADGTAWIVIADSYWGGKGKSAQAWSTAHTNRGVIQKPCSQISGFGETRPTDQKHTVLKPKDLIGIPFRLAMALQADGWYWRSDIIWDKNNGMPESAKDRPTNNHEHILLFSRSKKYYYDYKSIMELAAYDGRKDTKHKGSTKYREPMKNGKVEYDFASSDHERWQRGENGEYLRNKRSVWHVNTVPYSEAHFATFPPKLIEPCILAGCPVGGTVLDMFCGSGTVGEVCNKLGRNFVLIDLNPEYLNMIKKRTGETV